MNRFFTGIQHITVASFKNPAAFVQLVAGVILLILFVATLIEWIHSHQRINVEVPLLLIGVCSILLIILRTTHAFAISVAVLIIGTVVAGDRFMLAVTALLKGNTPESMKFVSDLYVVTPGAAMKGPDTQALASQITSIAKEAGSDEQATKVVTKVLEQAQAQSLLAQIRSEHPAALTPLDELMQGGDRWQSFASNYKSSTVFKTHMNLLRRLQVVTFPGDNYESAELTEIGKQLRPYLQSPRTTSAPRLPSGPEISNLADPRVLVVDVGKRKLLSFTTTSRLFARFHAEEEGVYEIETSEAESQLVDTLIVLKDSALKELAEDDDGGELLFSKLTRQLNKGDYVIEVRNIFAATSDCYINVSKVTQNTSPKNSPSR